MPVARHDDDDDVYIYIYIYTHAYILTHTHTHTHIYIYIYIYKVCSKKFHRKDFVLKQTRLQLAQLLTSDSEIRILFKNLFFFFIGEDEKMPTLIDLHGKFN